MLKDVQYSMDLVARPQRVMERGSGSFLWDSEGRKYLDFVQGWAVNTLGHCPKIVTDALAAQAEKLISPSPAYFNEPSLTLSRKLVERSGLAKAFLCSTGAEANEGAIKLARKWGKVHKGGAFEIITTIGAFHGRTLATMAATGKPGWDAMFPPNMRGIL